MPPSTDDLPGRKKPAPRRAKGSGRDRGKQKGAPGSWLPWVAEPDQYVPHRPQGSCGCGADLPGRRRCGWSVRTSPTTCPRSRSWCGSTTSTGSAAGAGASMSGRCPIRCRPRRRVTGSTSSRWWCTCWSQHHPVARCVELVVDLTATGPSTGFVHGMLDRVADTLHEVVDLIKTLITLSYVVGFDETTLRAARRPSATSCPRHRALQPVRLAAHLSFRDFDILPDFAGIAVHDRYQNYYNEADLAAHQACCSHLLRDFTDAAQPTPRGVPSSPARAARLIHAFNQARDTASPRSHRCPRPADQLVPPRRAVGSPRSRQPPHAATPNNPPG